MQIRLLYAWQWCSCSFIWNILLKFELYGNPVIPCSPYCICVCFKGEKSNFWSCVRSSNDAISITIFPRLDARAWMSAWMADTLFPRPVIAKITSGTITCIKTARRLLKVRPWMEEIRYNDTNGFKTAQRVMHRVCLHEDVGPFTTLTTDDVLFSSPSSEAIR